MLTVSAFEGPIVSRAQVSGTDGRRGSHAIPIISPEMSYAFYVIFITPALLFVNLSANTLHPASKPLTASLWIIFIVALIRAALITCHLIERPVRERIKLWRAESHPHKLATAHAR